MVLPVRSVAAENCTVLATTTEGMLGEIVTVAACNVLAAMSINANESSTVSNLRIFERLPDRKNRQFGTQGLYPVDYSGVPKVALARQLPLDVSK
jgi:hypothetical protein